MRASKLLLLATSIFAIGACASGGGGAGTAASGTATTISADDITQANVATAYDAINNLQRWWFNDPANQCTGTCVPLVYMNNQKQDGGIDGLRQIPSGDVATLEYVNGKDALVRYGQEASGGVIIITRK